MLGYSSGNIEDCKNNGKLVKSTSYETFNYDVWNVNEKATKNETFCFTGGIVGYNGLSNLINCENKAEIIGTYNGIGGIVGGSVVSGERLIENCFNYGSIRYNGTATSSSDESKRGVGGIVRIDVWKGNNIKL